jgi:His/Glu/Gln/Arg/opine family amino acid ABC transporter permease subunit
MTPWEIIQALVFGFSKSAEELTDSYPEFLQTPGGLYLSVLISICSLLLATPLGVALGFCRGKNTLLKNQPLKLIPLRLLAHFIITVVRGIPMMIWILLVVYHLPYLLLGLRLPAMVLAIIAFTIYASVYIAESFRSGLRAISPQYCEAARTLGLSGWQILRHIQLPIILRVMLPSLLGIGITIFKDTSILVVVAAGEMSYISRQLQMSEPKSYLFIQGCVLILYALIAILGTALVKCLEKRISINSTNNNKMNSNFFFRMT